MKESTRSETNFPLPQREDATASPRQDRGGWGRIKTMILLPALLIASFFFWFWLRHLDPEIFREHGPMENFQVGCLAVGIFFLARAMRGASSGPQRLFLGGLILLYTTFLLLEFDVREFKIPWLTALLGGTVRNIWVSALWVLSFVLFLRHARSTWAAFVAWFRTAAGVLLLIAGLFWASGWLIDHLKLFGSWERMMEELMEANAAPLMVISAILTFRSPRVRTRSGQAPP